MSVQIEIYRKEAEFITPEQEIAQIERDQRIKLAAKLGLNGVIERAHKQIELQAAVTQIGFPLMSDKEFRVWRTYLPTAYGQASSFPRGDRFYNTRPINAYGFDDPPISVLELWAELKERGVFSEYEIWTPERQAVDPILVGWRKSVGPFLIARWGESLKPFEEIKKEVDARILDQLHVATTWIASSKNMITGGSSTGVMGA